MRTNLISNHLEIAKHFIGKLKVAGIDILYLHSLYDLEGRNTFDPQTFDPSKVQPPKF